VSTDGTPENAPTSKGLGTRVAIGAAWMVGVRWGVRALGVVSTVVLARLLIPEDFGLVALATAYIAIVNGVTAIPMGNALIRFRDADDDMYNTAFTLSAVRGACLSILIVASAVPVAALMNEPRLETVIYVLALKPLLEGLQNPRFVDFDKELEFSRPAMLLIGVRVVQVIVTIVAAVVFRSYWALIIGGLVAPVFRVPLTYLLRPYLPGFSLKEVRRLFSFSGWLTAQGVLVSFNKQTDKFIFGALLDTKMVGVFHLGRELVFLPSRELIQPLTRALYPGFTIFADDIAKLRANTLEATAIVAAVTIPLGIGLSLVAEEFVLLLLGSNWTDVIPIVQIVTPFAAIFQITALLDAVVMALAKTRLMFYRACFQFILRSALVLLGIFYFGFMGGIYGWVLFIVIFLLYRMFEFSKILKTTFLSPITATWRTLVSSLAMTGAVLAVSEMISISPEDITSAALLLVSKTAVGAIVFASVHFLTWINASRPSGIESRLLALSPKFGYNLPKRNISS